MTNTLQNDYLDGPVQPLGFASGSPSPKSIP